jgi:hypothetical protein
VAEDEASPERLFTLDEANEMVAGLAAALERIREARQVVLKGGQPIRDSAIGNGGGERGKEYWQALHGLRADVEAVTRQGVILRDPETGLVDFPSRREGADVYLCWRLGEEQVMYWHPPDSGFGGRQPL